MGRCRRHPHHFVVGVCAHCLNDRLLALVEEEEDEELMLHQLSGMSPYAHYTYMPSPSSSSICINNNLCKNVGVGIAIATPARTSRASVDYTNAQTKQTPASSIHNRYHHFFSSSPQLHPSNATRLSQRSARASSADAQPPFVTVRTTRKKRSSLWSFLVRPKDNDIANTRQTFDGEHVRLRRDEFTGVVKVHRIAGTHRAEPAVGVMKQKLEHGVRADGNALDGFARSSGSKPSFSSSRREALESLSRNDAPSLLSSPKFMASPSRQACGHGLYPSPISKYTPPSPLNTESTLYRDSPRASPARQVPVSYGLSGHAESFGLSEYVQDDDNTSRQSWVSSLFSRRHGRAKSISGSVDAVSLSQASHHLHSVGASPESGSRERRKSVSFLDDRLQESPSRSNIVDKLAQSNGIGIGFKNPDAQHPHTYKGAGINYQVSKQPVKSPKGNIHSALLEQSVGQKDSRSHGDELHAGGLLASPTMSKADLTSSKSPRVKLANFLSKHKTGAMSMDCGRDVRVSPIPMLRVKKDCCTHHDVHDNSVHDQGCKDTLHRHLEHRNEGIDHRYAEHLVMDSRFKEELQKSSMAMDQKTDILKSPIATAASSKDTSKSPRLMSLQAMKQLLKSPRLAPVRTTKRESEDEEGQPYFQSTRSWSKAFSKTLSPMLGRKPKKKPSFRKQEFPHYAYTHSQRGLSEHLQQSDEDGGSHRLGKQNGHYGTYHYGNQLSAQELHHLRHQHGKRSGNGGWDELLVHETRVLPARADEKGPPQQYSFLSKDYSAFSFYFSPRRSGSIDSATQSSKKSSVW